MTEILQTPVHNLTKGVMLAGRYQVIEELGHGGMGVVYKARDTHLDRYVALKLLPAEKVADTDRKRRFVQEAKAASALNHPNIIHVYDIDQSEGTDFISMEYVDGRTLGQLISPIGMPLSETLKCAAQIAEALAAAHKAGIVHRDLKPANVMVTEKGLVKVLDFGLAKLAPLAGLESPQTVTAAGTIMGTLSYMSPEQAEGRPVDGRSDIFSLGAVLYEVASGIRAFERDSGIATLAAVLNEQPTPLRNVPAELAAIISRCLCKNPSDRFQRADEIIQALKQVGGSAPVPAIAVLPFTNMSDDKEDEYFSDGLTEEVINALTKIAGLRVTARTSSFAFRGKEQDIREIGARLAVDNILEGSVRRAGNRIRVTVQLIKVSDACHLWSERYEREITDVFAIQDEISQVIADKLRVGFGQERRTSRRPTDNLEAYNLYLQGRYHLSKFTPEGFAKAKQCFEQAVALDPSFALAYDALSEFYWYLGFFGFIPPKEAFLTGIWAALRAVEIDDTLAETHALIGMYRKELDYNWLEVKREMNRALDLNPSSSTVRIRNVLSGLMPLGRMKESVEELKIVIESDPLSLFARWWLGIMYFLARDNDFALEQAQFIIDTDSSYYPGHWLRGLICLEKGALGEAVAEFREAVVLSGSVPLMLGWLGLGLARAGEAAAAGALLDRLAGISRTAYVPPSSFAWIHLGLGNADEAFTWMERAIDARDPMIVPIKTYPFLDPLRSDPRFHALLRKMNLEP
jgi:serine/threonine-protein kinase